MTSNLPEETPGRITQMAQAVQSALDSNNYSLRLEKSGEGDEAGLLADVFNKVLVRLHDQARNLEQRRLFIKEEVAIRTHDLEKEMRELNIAKREAELGSRSKSVFLSNMSHELRTPLNAIIGYCEMLQEEVEDLGQEALLPDLQKISIAGKRLAEWVDEILDLSRIESGRSELEIHSFDIMSLIRETESAVLPMIQEAGNHLDVRCDAAIGLMNADQNRIQRVLFSLLKNASKSTQKGTVVLSVSREAVDGVDWINFDVIDSGPGISPDILRSLFKDYTQADAVTSSVYGGTALAVAICQRFSFMMGGNVFVESEPGKGATFTLRIPAEMQVHLSKSHVVRATNRLIRDLLDFDIKEKDAK